MMGTRSYTPGALVKWASRVWVVPCLIGMAILVLSVMLRMGGGFGWPQRVVQATFWVTAILAPVGGVGYTSMAPPWRALGRAARDLLVVLLIATTLTIFALLIRDQGRIVAQAPYPVLYALGGFIAAWIMLMVVLVAAVLLGTTLQAQERRQRPSATVLIGGLLMAEGIVLSSFALTLHAFFNLTLGGAGLIHWAGLPLTGVVFPWATFTHIIGAAAVVGLPLIGCLAVAELRADRLVTEK